jgi:uncharacterized protein YndB with AHSA1/START domain
MDHNLAVWKTVTISRPREVVWRVLTEPAYVKKYLFGADLVTDWAVGSPVLFRGEFEGQPWQDKGIVLVYEPPSRLEYSYYSGSCGLADQPGNYATVTYKLDEQVNGTVLTVRQQGYAREESRASSSVGWDGVLAQVKALAEG